MPFPVIVRVIRLLVLVLIRLVVLLTAVLSLRAVLVLVIIVLVIDVLVVIVVVVLCLVSVIARTLRMPIAIGIALAFRIMVAIGVPMTVRIAVMRSIVALMPMTDIPFPSSAQKLFLFDFWQELHPVVRIVYHTIIVHFHQVLKVIVSRVLSQFGLQMKGRVEQSDAFHQSQCIADRDRVLELNERVIRT